VQKKIISIYEGESRINMDKNNQTITYAMKVGDITFIVKNSFEGTQSLSDAFEDIIVSSYREKHGKV